jgi:hypothetical protein
MTKRFNSGTALATASIFSALVGSRPVLAPEDGNGGGSGFAGGSSSAGAEGGAGKGAEGEGGGAGGASAGSEGAGGTAEGEGSILAGVAGDVKKEDKPGEGDPAKPAGEGEPKKEGEPAAEDTGPKDVDGKPIPETYDIKMPDGISMDKDLLAEVTPLFRDAKLSPAQAQVVADAYMQNQTKAIEAHNNQVKAWAAEAKADKEFGGPKFAENMGAARKAFTEFGSERALQIFDTYGLGNNPEVLRMFVRIGKAMGEGGTILGGDGGGRVSAARDMYPSMYQGKQ